MTGDVTVKDVSVVSPGLRASIVKSLSVVTALVIVMLPTLLRLIGRDDAARASMEMLAPKSLILRS